MTVERAPLWVRLLDAAVLACLCLTVLVLIFGSIDLHYSLTPWRLNSPLELLFVAASAAAIRHAAHPATPLHARVRDAAHAIGERPASRAAVIALTSRVAVLAAGYLAVRIVGVTALSSGFQVSPYPLINLPARFDAGWYGSIALDGYSFGGDFERQENIAFFPAFPLLMRAVGYPLGAFGPGLPREKRLVRLLWGGVAIALGAFAWAAAYLWRLARDILGEDRAASHAVLLLAAYPFAVYFSAPYTESLFLLGTVAAVYHFRREAWLPAGAWGLLVGLTRPNGCFLSVVLAALIVAQISRSADFEISKFPHAQISKSAAAAAAAAMPGIGMLAFSLYVRQLTGHLFGWVRLHESAWGRTYHGLALPLPGSFYDVLNASALALAAVMVWPVLRRAGPALALFIVISVAPPLLAGGLLSMGRLTSTLFPMFIALAAASSSRTIAALVTAFVIGQAGVAAVFFSWRPLF
jgi:hypothetical protein